MYQESEGWRGVLMARTTRTWWPTFSGRSLSAVIVIQIKSYFRSPEIYGPVEVPNIKNISCSRLRAGFDSALKYRMEMTLVKSLHGPCFYHLCSVR